MKKIFSGVQPSGLLHLGNYLGAIKQWVSLQESNECIFCIVDLHAITVPQEPRILKENILSLAALYLALGVNPEKSAVFVQSSRPEHSELAWILNCHSNLGELKRMTQFKDKSGVNQESVSVGLFDYPILMAADILLYQTTDVPVGEDQKQHVELTRDIAERFNKKYGRFFTVPKPLIPEKSARIMGLDDPAKKMSKSSQSANNYISLLDDPSAIENKIKRAVTDSGSEIKSDPSKPAITNLMNIYSEVSGLSLKDIELKYKDKNYGEFKTDLAKSIIDFLNPIQEKYLRLMSDQEKLAEILANGAKQAEPVARETLSRVREVLGLGI